MFLDKKTMLEIWLNPGLNLTIFSMRNQAQKIICLTPIWGTCLFFFIRATSVTDWKSSISRKWRCHLYNFLVHKTINKPVDSTKGRRHRRLVSRLRTDTTAALPYKTEKKRKILLHYFAKLLWQNQCFMQHMQTQKHVTVVIKV